MPTTSIPLSYPVNLLTAITVTGAGAAFALPAKSVVLSWQASYDVAPAAVSITLEVSIDGVLWTVLDTTTAVGGEVRTIANPTSAIFVRVNVGTNTGSRAATVIIVAKPAR